MNMSKKSKRSKQLQNRQMPPQLLVKQVSHAQNQIQQGDFEGVIDTCQPLLSLLPRRSPLRVHALALLGLAHGMLEEYQDSYDLFTEALTIDPTNADLWYNRGLASRYTTRLGQAMRDFERAVELSRQQSVLPTDSVRAPLRQDESRAKNAGELGRKFAKELKVSRKDLQEAMELQGEDLTLDQYIEREEYFTRGMSFTKKGKWKEAEQVFRQIIEMGGKLPIYWGNLGVSLIMQLRYDEAEAAFKRALEIDPSYTFARNNLEKLPDVRRAGGPLGVEVTELVPKKDLKQTITFYKPGEQGKGSASSTAHTTIEKTGNTIKGTRKQLGKQPPRYRYFLNPYQDVRFTTCPQCGSKTRQRKFPLVIHVDPMYTIILGKTCRYCTNCDLLIVHQDQLEEQLVGHFSELDPEIIGNDYLVMGTVDRPEWRQGMQDPLSMQEMLEHLHDFKEAITLGSVKW